MITVEQFTFHNEAWHSLIRYWFMDHFKAVVTQDMLSGYGFMALNGEKPFCAVFLYPVLGSRSCLIGWPVSDKGSSKEERNEAIPMLFNKAESVAKSLGYRLMSTYVSTDAMHERCKQLNYVPADKNVTQYYKGI